MEESKIIFDENGKLVKIVFDDVSVDADSLMVVLETLKEMNEAGIDWTVKSLSLAY